MLSLSKDIPWLGHWKVTEQSCWDVPQHTRACARRGSLRLLGSGIFYLSAQSCPGLPSTARLVHPPPSKSHNAGCRSICYKSSSLGKGRKHNFHKTLLNWRKSSRPFLWKCCTPPGALCDLSCLESKWNRVSQRGSNGYFSKKEKLNFTMGILPLPWPLQQLTGTQEELTSSEDWFIMWIFKEFHLGS